MADSESFHRPWNDAENALLMELWSDCVHTKDIAIVLGRTKRACDQQIMRLKKGYRVRRILIPEDD